MQLYVYEMQVIRFGNGSEVRLNEGDVVKVLKLYPKTREAMVFAKTDRGTMRRAKVDVRCFRLPRQIHRLLHDFVKTHIVAHQCCRDRVPSVVGQSDGTKWVCPDCGKKWIVETDEAEGSAWWPV